jgi:hypothetical protein
MNTKFAYIVGALIILLGIFAFIQIKTIQKAHEAFDGYCKWRGLEIVSKSDNFGYCRDAKSGKEFKMILFDGKWYLDGDLPPKW